MSDMARDIERHQGYPLSTYAISEINRIQAELQSWQTICDYARGNGAEGSGPGDLQALIEGLQVQLAAAQRERDNWQQRNNESRIMVSELSLQLSAARAELEAVRRLIHREGGMMADQFDERAKKLVELLAEIRSAVWDSHYGKGLSVNYARVTNENILNAIMLVERLKVELSATRALAGKKEQANG